MQSEKLPSVIALVVLLCAAAGCNSTRIASESKSSDLPAVKYKKVLVIGVSPDQGLRQLFEEEFVKALAARGVIAISSYQQLPEAKPTREAVEKVAGNLNVDAVLVSRLIERNSQTQFDPGVASVPANISGYYDDAWKGAYEPPSTYTVTVVRIETRLFDAASGKLAWSAETETFDPKDREKEIRNLSGVLIGAMSKQNLI
jgi:hypothetical protein